MTYKNTCIYNNGVKNIRLQPDEQPPEGYVRGQVRRPYTEEEKRIMKEKRNKTCMERYGDANYRNPKKVVSTRNNGSTPYVKGKHFYNNGEINKLLFPDEVPEGWVQGRINNHQPSMKWITNGVDSILIPAEQKVPEGYISGRHIGKLPEEKKQHALEARKATNMNRYGFENPLLDENKVRKYAYQLKTSNSEPNIRFEKSLISKGIEYEREFPIKSKRYDFKVGDTLIEINPYFTHNSTKGFNDYMPPKAPSYHYDKTQLAISNGYRCINVFDWDDICKIINLLTPRKTLYARNTQIKIVEDKKIVKEFLDTYHLQNYIKYDVAIGLYDEDELVSIMTFGKPRYNKKYEWELLRYCSKYNITGGSEKLFKYFEEMYKPKSIISYCDLSKFNGSTYEKLGFKLKSISYSKHWYCPSIDKHITDNLLRQRGFDQLFNTNYGKGTSNEELMREHGFVEIYDCGQATYIKEYN